MFFVALIGRVPKITVEFHKKDELKRKFTGKIHKRIFSIYWYSVIIITAIKNKHVQ